MSRRIITLTTDFGEGSPYVAQMKGVILSLNPEANIVDISHAVPAQDVQQGAIVLKDVAHTFPAETIHVAVVDPGVGSDRKIVCANIGQQYFIAPDNGLLSRVAKASPPSEIIVLTNREYWLGEVSSTFHGRDIMAPVAAYLSLGMDPRTLGEPTKELVRLSVAEVKVAANEIKGMIVSFDSFGNLITDIPATMLAEARRSKSLTIHCGQHQVGEIVTTYSNAQPQTLIALIGSSHMLELAVAQGNAAATLGINLGDEVSVTW